jgi:cytoskeletal protein RodZ
MPALGDEFRAAREARHLSLSDVAEQVHIRSTYLESIENEDWSAIAAPVYVKGFLRTYARFLGLDQEDAVRRYIALVADGAIGSQPAPRPMGGSRPAPRSNPSPLLWLGGLVAIALVAFVVWSFYQYRSQPAATAAMAAASPQADGAAPAGDAGLPSGDASAVPAHAPASKSSTLLPHSLTLRAKGDSWMSVSADGTSVFAGFLKAGTAKTFRGATVAMHAGNAGDVEVIANGKDIGALGPPGEVVDRTFDLTKTKE